MGRFLNRFNIGGKLNIGFGILVALTLLVVGLSYLASAGATTNINTTTDISAPTALASARAQANLLTMLGDVRGYLALGDEEYRTSYQEAKAAFEADLAELEALKQQRDPAGPPSTNPEFDRRLEELEIAFEQWSELPDQLFDLHDDQLQREPALRLLLQEGNPLIASIVVDIRSMITTQQQRRDLSAEDIALLGEMADFQASFFAMIAGLRGYVTTGRDNFKFEYVSNLTVNDEAWEKLRQNEALLNNNQQNRLASIAQNREVFLALPVQMFEAVEGEHAREDLYLFRTEAIPLAETMLQLLNEMTVDQQELLQSDLSAGRSQLAAAQWQTLVGGLVALGLALILAFVFRANIAGPVQRLTQVAEQIGAGDLAKRATVESGDEIGVLAQTFNQMTDRLGQTLDDLELRRRELQGQNEYLSALHETSLGLLNRLDLNELLEDLVNRAAHLLDSPYGYIYLVEPDLNLLELKVVVGISERQLGDRMQLGEGLAGKVWQTKQPVIVDDYDTWSGRSPEIRHGLIRALAGIPLIQRTTSAAEVVGVIGLGYTAASNRTFGQAETELLTRFAELASIALDNARLFEGEQRQRQMAESMRQVADILNSSLDRDIVFDKIMEQLGNVIHYDGAGVYLLEGQNLVLNRAAAEADVYTGARISLSSSDPTVRIVKTGQPHIIADVRQDPNWQVWEEGSAIRSWMGAPMVNAGNVTGVLTLDNHEIDAYSDRDASVLQTFANQAALAIQRAEIFEAERLRRKAAEAELEVARRLQQMLLPTEAELAQVDGLDIAGYMEPADEVGGDYYDVLQHNGQVKIGMGDVTGHGLESGVVMLMTQMGVRTLLTNNETDATHYLTVLNRTVYDNVQRMQADKSLTLVLLDYTPPVNGGSGQVRLSGQHEELIVVRQGGQVELIDTLDLGFPIGLDEDIADFVAEHTLQLQPGDGLVLYTDGITEAENEAGEQYELDRLCEVVSQHWTKSADDVKSAVIEDVMHHIGAHTVYDDITLLVVKQK